MRERVEDLGRLAVMLDDAVDSDLFEITHDERFMREYLVDDLSQMDAKADHLERLFRQIHSLHDDLHEMLEIARGHDCLNGDK